MDIGEKVENGRKISGHEYTFVFYLYMVLVYFTIERGWVLVYVRHYWFR